MCWSLSPVFVKKRRREAWAIKKKWTHEGPSIEKKERKKEIAILSKEFI